MKSTVEFVYEANDGITTVSSADPTITRRASAAEADTPGYWITWLPDQENPYESPISGGYTSRDEAIRAAERYVRTCEFIAPKGEPRPIWLNPAGEWQLIKVTQLWPLVPSGLLLDFKGGRGMLVREWELKGKSGEVIKAYKRGAQPQISVVERRVMSEATAFEFRLKLNLAQMQI
jgi:hypothetical protein